MSSALARLADGGRLVAITGAGCAPDHPAWSDAFIRLQEHGRVVFSAAIDGRVYAGSWSEHCLNWLPRHRQNTLLLRYEAITDDPNQAVEDVAAFLGMLPVRDFSIDFSYLHQLQPALFRVGDDAPNIAELGPSEPRFRERHGAVMRELGYYDP